MRTHRFVQSISLFGLTICCNTVSSFFHTLDPKSSSLNRQKKKKSILLHKHNARVPGDENYIHTDPVFDDSRRLYVARTIAASSSIFGLTWLTNRHPSYAGLVMFPCTTKLLNTYHLMRAGESLLETQDIFSTNPLFLTNHEDTLSPKGMDQVLMACQVMTQSDVNPSVVKYSLAAKAIDTASLIASEMRIGRNRLIPEFTFMDPRAVGKWDMQKISFIEDTIWAYDQDEAGPEGRGGLPPPNDDGTPNETLYDQSIRLRQLLSGLETQYSGDTILLIFPDGTSPALLTAMIGGVPFNRVHELNFEPGEIQLNVTYENARNRIESLSSSTSSSSTLSQRYSQRIQSGREKLQSLLKTNADDLINVKDQIFLTEQQQKKTEQNIKSSLQRERAQSTSSLKNYNDNKTAFPDLFPMGALFITGIMASFKWWRDDNNTISVVMNQDTVDSKGNIMNRADSPLIPIRPESVDDTKISDVNSTRMLSLVETYNSQVPNEVDTKEYRTKRANEAMDEYLNKDDGGEDWLSTISNIMNED